MRFLSILFLSAGLIFTIISCKETAPVVSTAGVVATGTGIEHIATKDMAIINWEGSKPTGLHTGNIQISEGKVYVDNGKITAGSFTIDMNTITVTDITGEEKTDLEAHLKGTEADGADHFFNVTKFPTGKFEVTSVKDTTMENTSNALISGNLTLKGITQEIAIPANVTITTDGLSVISNTFKINRTLWGINYKSKSVVSDLGDKFINDDIALQINLNAKPAPAQ
jgi:polyisoprenoid-binding protein YceI